MINFLNNLNGRTAVVTGAGGGIGFATCNALASSGAKIVGLVRNNTDTIQEKFKTLPNTNLQHQLITTDITNPDELLAAVSEISCCDILVNSAGFSEPIPHKNIHDLTDDFFDSILIANLRSVFSTIRAFVPLLSNSDDALIVNISSASAINPGHGSNIAYAAAKAGVENMTKNLALALAPNIRVVSICPSSVDTGFLPHPKKFYEDAAMNTPLKRIATPEDIASAVLSCATQLKFITGNSLVVDGGRFLV